MAYYYTVMDTRRSKFPQPSSMQTPVPSEPGTPTETPTMTQTNTPTVSDDEDDSSPVDHAHRRGDRHTWNGSISLYAKRHKHRHRNPHGHHSLFHLPHHNLLREALNQSQEHHPVGVFESQHYMNIERRLYHPHEASLEENSVRVLSESVHDLLTAVGAAMNHIVEWLDRTNSDRLRLRPQKAAVRTDALATHKRILEQLKEAMAKFVSGKRCALLLT